MYCTTPRATAGEAAASAVRMAKVHCARSIGKFLQSPSVLTGSREIEISGQRASHS
jgi:hypothetical protein